MSFIKAFLLAAILALASPAFAAASVDINTADAKTLQTLDGIGASKAQAIVEYRQANGPFKSADELAKVKGIGGKTLEANRDRITVSGDAAGAKKAAAKN